MPPPGAKKEDRTFLETRIANVKHKAKHIPAMVKPRKFADILVMLPVEYKDVNLGQAAKRIACMTKDARANNLARLKYSII